ncbi:MAG: hypothetical protein IT243_02565 [Bacteroidia bacterium]|nr:hypothetical protein [Bacteroidia bacterium]
MPPGSDKRLVMETTANSFSSLTTDNVIIINPSLYEFGVKLISERQTITSAYIASTVPGLAVLTLPDKLTLWDNLFYQTIKQASPYTREAIICLLVANYFAEQYAATPSLFGTDEDVRNWASSRLIMPSVLFGIDEDYHTATSSPNLPTSTLVKRHVDAAEGILKADLAKKALQELNVLERNYHKTQKAAEKLYVNTYNASLKASVQSAPKVQVVDEISGFTFDHFAGSFAIPTFTYEPAPQIVVLDIQAAISDVSFYSLNENGLLAGDSYAEVSTDTNKYIKDQNSKAFSFTAFAEESIDINGTAVPTCSLDNRYNQNNSYYIKFVKKAANKYALIIAVDVKNSCLKINSASITVGTGPGTTFTKFKACNMNGVITIDFTPNSFATISGSPSTTATTGQIILDNGLVLTWNISVDMTEGSSGVMTVGQNSTGNQKLFIPSGYGLKRLGIADYKRVEQSLCCYKPGEVSHIENILAREYKERSTRRLRRSEDTTTSSSEAESENLTDTSSTSRFDMQKEVSTILRNSREFGITGNFHIGANYGTPVAGVEASLDLGANFATSSSKEQSNKEVSNFAKDVTQKALERVVSKVREERVTKVIEEFEENNKHGFDNRQGDKHISGVYRWVDAEYKNKIFNYGKRLHYEFMIPEPSAFHIIAKANGVSAGNEIPLILPLDPTKDKFGTIPPLKTASSINEENYQFWAAAYKAEVSPPPPKVQLVGKTYRTPDDGKPWYEGTKGVTDQIILPEGYGLRKAYVAAMGETVVTKKPDLSWSRYYISVADNTRQYWCGEIIKQMFLEDNETTDLEFYTESIPVSIQFIGINGGIVTITLELLRKEDVFAAWQLQTYNAILKAYEDRLQEYKDALAELEIKKSGMADNPAYYREIEQIVLKKNCISYLIGHTNMGKSFVSGAEIKNFQVNITKEMDEYASAVKFFEQAFEWDIMSYRFYPFYWAGNQQWLQLYGQQSSDPMFKAFLQSGMARVFVTIRPGFEEAVMHYMSTGQIWNGGEVPVIGDKLYLSIIQELKKQEFYLDGYWKTKLPTTLTVLQQDSLTLTSTGLPCWCDTSEPPENFTSSDPFTGLDVFIEGSAT